MFETIPFGVRDDTIVAKAITEDRIVVTANARDYRRLLAREPLYPGALLIEPWDRPHAWQLILLALAFIELQSRQDDYMVNRVIEVTATGGIVPYELSDGTI